MSENDEVSTRIPGNTQKESVSGIISLMPSGRDAKFDSDALM